MFACVGRPTDSPRSLPFPETVVKIPHRAKMAQVSFVEKVFDSCFFSDILCGLVVSSWLQMQESGFDSRRYQAWNYATY
jgi:hypothetical protein